MASPQRHQRVRFDDLPNYPTPNNFSVPPRKCSLAPNFFSSQNSHHMYPDQYVSLISSVETGKRDFRHHALGSTTSSFPIRTCSRIRQSISSISSGEVRWDLNDWVSFPPNSPSVTLPKYSVYVHIFSRHRRCRVITVITIKPLCENIRQEETGGLRSSSNTWRIRELTSKNL